MPGPWRTSAPRTLLLPPLTKSDYAIPRAPTQDFQDNDRNGELQKYLMRMSGLFTPLLDFYSLLITYKELTLEAGGQLWGMCARVCVCACVWVPLCFT